MTPRVRAALLDIINNPAKKAFKVLRSGKKPSDQLVFGVSNNVRTAWAGALKDAGLTDVGLHFHDLRHTPGASFLANLLYHFWSHSWHLETELDNARQILMGRA